jgi:histidyl-tRNA synthetase
MRSVMIGFAYLHGQDLACTKKVIRACERILEQAHFEEIRTPLVVAYSTVVGETDRPVAPSHADIVFGLQTGGGEKLALSYENTLPVCIYYIKNCADVPPMVARRFFYISAHFRNETTITSDQRLRQFHQIGYEIIGGRSTDTLPVAIGTGSTLLTNLGLSHSIRVSDVTILSALFKRLGLDPGERSTLRSLYDSGDRRAFECFLAGSILDARQKALLARLFFSRDAALREIGELFRENGLEDMLAQVERINDVLGRLPQSVRQCASIDLGLVRNARMYTGIIFQFYFEGGGHECGGGGEYNRIIRSLGGPDVMACGAAFGLERITHAFSTFEQHLTYQREVLSQAPGRRIIRANT